VYSSNINEGIYEVSYNLNNKNVKYTFKHESYRPELILYENNKFKFKINYCEGMYFAEGYYVIKKNILILNFEQRRFSYKIEKVIEGSKNSKYYFEILNKKELKFLGEMIGCNTYKDDIFIKK